MNIKPFRLLFFLALLSACSTRPVVSDTEAMSRLHRGAGSGNVRLVQDLIGHGADVNSLDPKTGVNLLHKAVYSGDPEMVKLLLDKGALVDVQSPSNGDTALHDAIYFKDKIHGREIISLLLEHHACLDIRNRAGLTPMDVAKLMKDQATITQLKNEENRRHTSKGRELMKAVRENNVKAVEKLLADKTTPLEEADDQGFTPLLWASRQGFVKMTRLLLDHGASPNHVDSWMGANAGHKAAFWGRTRVMKLLIGHGLDFNARGLYNGYTPLHDAVAQGHDDTARVLLKAGARVDIQGVDGKTPLDLAKERGDQKLISEIISRLAPH